MRGDIIITSIISGRVAVGQTWARKAEKRKKKLSTGCQMPRRVPGCICFPTQRRVGVTQRYGAHCVTKVVLFAIRRDSTCGSATGSLCRSRSNDAGTAELRAESDDVDERIGEARFRTRGRGGNEEGAWWFNPADCSGGWDRGEE